MKQWWLNTRDELVFAEGELSDFAKTQLVHVVEADPILSELRGMRDNIQYAIKNIKYDMGEYGNDAYSWEKGLFKALTKLNNLISLMEGEA